MPNIRSAAKRVRQTKTRTARNRSVRSNVRQQKRALVETLENGQADQVQEALRQFYKAVDKAAKGNVLHKNAASRLKSRAAALVAAKAA